MSVAIGIFMRIPGSRMAPAESSRQGLPRRRTSLPLAGFCVYRAYDTGFVIEMFTTHRAEPSWT